MSSGKAVEIGNLFESGKVHLDVFFYSCYLSHSFNSRELGQRLEGCGCFFALQAALVYSIEKLPCQI